MGVLHFFVPSPGGDSSTGPNESGGSQECGGKLQMVQVFG